jgi:DNA-binding NarL/FixJ family response regulator
VIRVVVGEGSFLAREGIVRVLGEVDGLEVAAVCGDLPSLQDAVERLRPDVVLTDARLPPSETDEGIRLAERLRSTQPEVGVVVLTGDELERAVREVAAGGALVDPRVVDRLLRHVGAQADSPLGRLTPRERETLALVAEGRTNRGIASELGITDRAVERHINSIFAKLGLAEEERIDRRVKAAILYLSARA